MYRGNEQVSGRKDPPLGDFAHTSALIPSNPEKLFLGISMTVEWDKKNSGQQGVCIALREEWRDTTTGHFQN